MRRYALRRTFLGILTVIIVSIIIFIAARLSGDVAILIAPPDASDEEIHAIRVQLGLNKSIPYQYYVFAKNAIKGDFGRSIRYNRPAMDVLIDRFSGSVELVGTAFIVAIITGVLLGTLSATRRGTWLDQSGKLFGAHPRVSSGADSFYRCCGCG